MTTSTDTDRITIEGEVTRLKWPRDSYGQGAPWQGQSYKITVRTDDGKSYFGPLPTKLRWDIIDFGPRLANGGFNPKFRYGVRVRFTAAVTKSEKIENFWFYSRPAKAEKLGGEVERAE